MKQFLEYLISPLLSDPDQFSAHISPGRVIIHVAPADTGKIIGKKGVVINALRILLKTYCANQKLSFHNLTLDAVKTDSPVQVFQPQDPHP